MLKHYLSFFCSLCLIMGLTFAQSPIKPATLVSKSKTQGFTFESVDLFELETSRALADYPIIDRMVTEATILNLDPATLGQFRQNAPATMTLRLPSTSRSTLELELVEVNPFAEDFKVVTDQHPEGIAIDRGKHYRGVVKGSEGSLVAISFLQGEVMGMVALPEEGNFVLGRVVNENNREESVHVLYRDDQMRVANDFHCETPDDGYIYTEEEVSYRSTDESRALSDCVRFYYETEVDMFTNKGSEQAVVDYVTGINNQVATIYSNESINTTISEIFVWTTTDPYTSSSSSGSLSQFQAQRGSGFNGDLGQLLTFRNVGGGIAAGFDGICNSNPAESLSFSAINTTYADYPAYSWTVMVVTHEFGHTFGSRHTHACVWNGNGTAIDGCAGFVEGSCPLLGNPPGGGTIMSYCHQTSVGINPALGFGPQPGNVIRNEVDNGNCLQPCSNPNAPAAPTGLNATTVSGSEIDIDWTDNANDEDGFIIQRSSGSGFSQIATVGANTTSYSDNGLNQLTTYTYRVAAYNSDGNSSFSNTASATTTSDGGGGGPCSGCVDFSTTATISYSNQDAAANVTVLENGAILAMFDNTWRRTTETYDVTANTVIEFDFLSNAQGEIHGIGFDNDDALSSNLIFQVYGSQNWGIRDFDYTSVGNFQSFSIPVGQYYTGNGLYLVLVNDNDAGSGNNSYFRNVKIYEDVGGPTPPNAPSGLSATANSSSQIGISWTDNSNDEDDFVIERSSGGGFSQIAVVAANTTSYTDNGLSASTSYTYRVAARNAAGTSSWSNQASATTDDPAPTVPNAPSGLSATANSSSQIDINWTDNSNNEDDFVIERSSGGGFSQIAVVAANTTSYTDNGLSASTTYTYRVAARNVAGTSSWSNEASATTDSDGSGPCPECIDFSTTATISYSNQDSDENVSVLDNGATLGMFDNTWRRTTETYNVTANTVIEFEFLSNSQGEIHGIGFDNDDALSPNLIFQVYGTQDWGNRDFDYTTVGSYQSLSIPVGTYYTGNNLYLVLVNDNDAGSGNNSYFRNVRIYEDGSGPTVPNAPSGLSALANSSSQIGISWNDNSNNEDDFVIERSSGGGFSQIAVVAANTTSYTDNGLSALTTYTYRVAARNTAGTSSWSNEASATTDSDGGGCTTVTIEDNDFESGWGMWNDGGSDARRGNDYPAFASNSGVYSVRLRDNNDWSTMTTDNLNLTSFEEITVDFTYITNSFDNSNEDFWLQVSTNGGASFTTVEEWNLNDEFVNNVREFDAVTITSASVGGFTSNTQLRFRCDASANGDQVYIDDVVVTGCSNTSTGTGGAIRTFTDKSFDNTQDDLEDLTALNVYPNPTTSILNIDNLPEGAVAKLYDTKGRLIHQVAKGEDEISLDELSKGIYVLQVTSDEIVKTVKVVKE